MTMASVWPTRRPAFSPPQKRFSTPIHFEGIVPWRHAYVSNGIAQTSGIGVFIAGPFHTRDLPQSVKGEERWS